MLSRSRRASRARATAAPSRSRFDLESLESRTLLSGSGGSLALAMFNTSYAMLQLLPVLQTETIQRDEQGTATPQVTSQPETVALVNPVVPPEFLGTIDVVIDPDGTSGAIVDYRAVESGAYTATARWDGGAAESVVLDQPGELGHDPGVGSVYAQRRDLAAGQHTLELTVTHAASGASATVSESFTVPPHSESPVGSPSVPPGPIYDSPDPLFESGDGAGTDSLTAATFTAPTVSAVFFDSSAWVSDFRTYLASNNYGDAGYRVPDGAAQFLDLPWSNLNRVSLRFSENVTVQEDDLMLSGAAVTTYGYAQGGFSYDPATWTATWTLDRNITADKLRLQLRDTVHDSAGEALDGEWTDGSDTYVSGDGEAGGVSITYNGELNNPSHKALIGGLIDLGVEIDAPAAWQQQLSYAWELGNGVLYDYVIEADDKKAYTVPVKTDNGADAGAGGVHFGTAQRDVRFFNVSTSTGSAGPETKRVSLSVGNLGGATYQATTNLDVYTPTTAGTATYGNAGFDATKSRIGLFGGPDGETGVVF